MLRFIFIFFTFFLSFVTLNSVQPHELTQYTIAELTDGRLINDYYIEGSNQVGGRVIEITDPYDPRIGKVKTQSMVLTPDEIPVIIVSYLYHDGETEVIDKLGAHTFYRFQNNRLCEIETECCKEHISWMEEKPFIECYAQYDKSDRLIKTIHYKYDDEGKLIQETAAGNFFDEGEESFNRFRSYNSDGSLAVMWDDQGFFAEYQYDPETKNILSTETPNTRKEHQYNQEGVLTSVRVLEKETGRIQEVFVTMPSLCDRINSPQFIDNKSPSLFSLNTLWRCINAAARYINQRVNEELAHCAETYQIVDTVSQFADSVGCELLGPEYMRFAGFHPSESETGIYGQGCEPQKYRITFVNGILTTKENLKANMQLISEAHDGCSIHYCYVGTRGWTNDLVRSSFCKMGVTSPEAKELARIWRELIQDLGGPQSGGIIFHYAHSLGGTETHLAKFLLTPEELKMIKVITFGSPTLIPDEEFHSVVNLISCRDIISAFDPVGFISALIFETNSFFVGSHWDGAPIVDHPFYSYWTYLQAHFWEELEDLLNDLK